MDRQPTDEIFADIKQAALQVWERYDNTYGYVDEKKEMIERISNFKDNWYTFIGMMDGANQTRLMCIVKPDTLKFLDEQRVNYLYSMPFELTRDL